jgi:hypothetical protein
MTQIIVLPTVCIRLKGKGKIMAINYAAQRGAMILSQSGYDNVYDLLKDLAAYCKVNHLAPLAAIAVYAEVGSSGR